MFAADRAPNWSDGDNCHRCRVQFSVIVRKVGFDSLFRDNNFFKTISSYRSIIAEHADKCFVVNALLVAAHYQNSVSRRRSVFARIASTNTTRKNSLPNIIKREITQLFLIFHLFFSDGRTGRDESDSTSKPTELKTEKTRKEEELKLQEEEELQLAIALSRSEVEHKKESGNKMHIQRTYSSPVKVHSTLNKYNNNILMINFRRKIRRQK